jgi:hypothetical protein
VQGNVNDKRDVKGIGNHRRGDHQGHVNKIIGGEKEKEKETQAVLSDLPARVRSASLTTANHDCVRRRLGTLISIKIDGLLTLKTLNASLAAGLAVARRGRSTRRRNVELLRSHFFAGLVAKVVAEVIAAEAAVLKRDIGSQIAKRLEFADC